MKVKEYLANDYVISRYCQTSYTEMRAAFMAGFEAAVDLVSERFDWVEAGNAYHDMRKVGEEEYESGK